MTPWRAPPPWPHSRSPKKGDWSYDNDWDILDIWDGARWRAFQLVQLRKRGITNTSELERAVARTELTIKLVTYNEGKESNDAIMEAARDAARTLVTVAMMLQEKRAPEISMFNEDFFEGTKEIVVDTEGYASDE